MGIARSAFAAVIGPVVVIANAAIPRGSRRWARRPRAYRQIPL